jgi:hypothetical protein
MAANRTLQKLNLIYELPFTALSAGRLLENKEGDTSFALDQINWRDVIIELQLDTLTGTSPTAKVRALTHNRSGMGLLATDVPVVQGDGTTAFETTNLTAAGTRIASLAPQSASGATKTNLARNVGLELVLGGTVTNASGMARLYVKGQ